MNEELVVAVVCEVCAGTDIRVTRLGEILDALKAYSLKHQREIYRLGSTPEDFVQDTIAAIFRRHGLDRYDPTKCIQLSAVVFNIATRALIDLRRKVLGAVSRQDVCGNPIQFVSMQTPVGHDEGSTEVGDLIAGDEGVASLLLEMIEEVPEEQISPNYTLSWQELFRFSVDLDAEEIAKTIGISASRVSQLQKDLVRRFLKPVQGKQKELIEQVLTEQVSQDLVGV